MTRKTPWRHLHLDAVIVARPGPWGNPHDWRTLGNDEAVRRYRRDLLAGQLVTKDIKGRDRAPVGAEDARRELAGRDVACWCGPDEVCHGDALLDIVNPKENRS